MSFAFFTAAQEKSITDNNVFLDSDQDGLSDEEERAYGTDSHKADSDGDSYSDGAEVKSGYDPARPAPGDKIAPETENTAISSALLKGGIASPGGENMTEEVINKLSALVDGSSPEGGQEVSLEDLQDIIEETLNSKVTETTLPQINEDEIKIKKQNYAKLSSEKRKAQEKEDFTKYAAAVTYILSSNSPSPITSESDLKSATGSIAQKIISALTTRNPAILEDISKSGEKTLAQMKDVEVPESLVDLHVKGLAFAKYALTLKDSVTPNLADPVSDLVKFSQMQSFMETLNSFGSEIQDKATRYGIVFDGSISQLAN